MRKVRAEEALGDYEHTKDAEQTDDDHDDDNGGNSRVTFHIQAHLAPITIGFLFFAVFLGDDLVVVAQQLWAGRV